MTYTVTLPNGDTAAAESFDAVVMAAETMIDDTANWLRDHAIVEKDGKYDSAATAAVQSKGLLV